jgi:hypothetical protein
MRHQVQDLESDNQIESGPQRDKLQKLGDQLVNSTEDIIRSSRNFISEFNQAFEFVFISNVTFEDADYRRVGLKEIEEIRVIFLMFDLKIKEMKKSTSAGSLIQWV